MTYKKIKTIFTLLLTIFTYTTCGSSKQSTQFLSLAGEWNILTVAGVKAYGDKTPYIGLIPSEKRLYGCAGCNRIMGTMEIKNEEKSNALRFEALTTTRMLCQNRGTESAIIEALGNVEHYEETNNILSLFDTDGTELMTLQRRPETTLSSLNGKWKITKVYSTSINKIEENFEQPYITFNITNMAIQGCSGCNNFNGEIIQNEEKNSSLSFNNIACTAKEGAGRKLEIMVLDALNNVQFFTITGQSSSTLSETNGTIVLNLERE